jgi:RNA polymerase sigma-70 factor (ECF subfamily)
MNTCIDQSRKKSVKAMTLKHNIGETDTLGEYVGEATHRNPEKKAESGLMQQHIENALQKLTDKERAVFILRHYQHLQLKEIADILKITVGTVKSTLFRAVQRLQGELAFYKADLGLENSHE